MLSLNLTKSYFDYYHDIYLFLIIYPKFKNIKHIREQHLVYPTLLHAISCTQ